MAHKSTNPAQTTSYAQKAAAADAAASYPPKAHHHCTGHAYTQHNEGQHTTQRGSPCLSNAHLHAGQCRPERAATTGQHSSEHAATIGHSHPEHAATPSHCQARQCSAVNHPHLAGEQHYRRPHPSVDHDSQCPQHLSQYNARVIDKQEEMVFARAIADDLVAHKVNCNKVKNTANTITDVVSTGATVIGGILCHLHCEDADGLITHDDDELEARELEEELEACKVNWKKVGRVFGGIAKTALHFLCEDCNGQLLTRDFDEALFTRKLSNELSARKVNWKNIHKDGVNWKNIHRDGEQVIVGVPRRQDEEVLARKFDDELMGRDMILDMLD